jgi:hypothetical protein
MNEDTKNVIDDFIKSQKIWNDFINTELESRKPNKLNKKTERKE